MRRSRSLPAILVGVLFIGVGRSSAQNLVPNWGFEEHDDCTMGVGWIDLHDWLIPSCTVDGAYYHPCNYQVGLDAGVPANYIGYQASRSGEAYVMLAAFVKHFWWNQTKFTAHLTQPLQAGQTYCAQLWLSLADSSEARCNLLHGMFAAELPSACGFGDSLWAAQAPVTFVTDQVDTASWSLVEAQYTAAGGEEYFTFGNFLPDSLTDVTYLGPILALSRSMFYVEDVYVGSCDVGLPAAGPALDGVRLWPNPADDLVNIQVDQDLAHATVELVDARGRSVRLEKTSAGRALIHIGSLPPGQYIVRLQSATRTVVTLLSVVRP